MAYIALVPSPDRGDGPFRRWAGTVRSASSSSILIGRRGTSAPWNAANHALDAAMTSRHLAHEFHEDPGGHDWMFWDGQIPHFLETMRSRGFVK